MPAIIGILAYLPYFCSRFPIMGYNQARRGGRVAYTTGLLNRRAG